MYLQAHLIHCLKRKRLYERMCHACVMPSVFSAWKGVGVGFLSCHVEFVMNLLTIGKSKKTRTCLPTSFVIPCVTNFFCLNKEPSQCKAAELLRDIIRIFLWPLTQCCAEFAEGLECFMEEIEWTPGSCTGRLELRIKWVFGFPSCNSKLMTAKKLQNIWDRNISQQESQVV